MPISHNFNYEKPKTIKEALQLLEKENDKAKILAGGTDLVVQLKEDILTPELLIDTKAISELNELKITDKELFIGANVTFSQIIETEFVKEKLPALWKASTTVASVGVRNRATIVGNICSAVPSLDSAPALLIYEAEVKVANLQGERTISIDKWFVAPKKTSLKNNELVLGISIKIPKGNTKSKYEKHGRYSGEDLAQAGVAVLIDENQKYKVAFCAVGPIPKRAYSIEKFLDGKKINELVISEAQKLVKNEISPITDIRATKKYRSEMIKAMLAKCLMI